MGYEQITLNDWIEMKEKLKRELLGVKQSFVRIGYVLRQMDDQKLYEQDGYKSVAEFAKAEYGLESSTVSRFMSINKEYSIDGYSEQLRPEYAELGRSQLEEMLKLPETDRQMIQPETPREDIRELKRFNKSGPETGIADDIRELVEMFFKSNREALNRLYESGMMEENPSQRIEIVNPSGNRTFIRTPPTSSAIPKQKNSAPILTQNESPTFVNICFILVLSFFPKNRPPNNTHTSI